MLRPYEITFQFVLEQQGQLTDVEMPDLRGFVPETFVDLRAHEPPDGLVLGPASRLHHVIDNPYGQIPFDVIELLLIRRSASLSP